MQVSVSLHKNAYVAHIIPFTWNDFKDGEKIFKRSNIYNQPSYLHSGRKETVYTYHFY